MLWHAAAGRAEALHYGMRAPARLDPADFPLTGRESAGDLFPWKEVEGDRNVIGATAVAVPGLVDGIGKAHARSEERHGGKECVSPCRSRWSPFHYKKKKN